MSGKIRLLLVLIIVLVLTALASNQVAWAGFSSEPVESANQQDNTKPASNDYKGYKGTVQPPPSDVTACEKGIYSIGGIATLQVNELVPGYCLFVFLQNHAFALGRIPDGAGKVLAHITFLRVFYHGDLVYKLPPEDGDAQVCYAVPPDKQAQIYFFDFYGPRFGVRSAQPSWEPLVTTIENGTACVPAGTTGAYALIGK